MSKIIFKKYSAAGNDFVIIDLEDNPKFIPEKVFIQKICDRNFGIGADGVLLIQEAEGLDFKLDYFNADGSTGALCGNGARCALKYSSTKLGKMGKMQFLYFGLPYSGEIFYERVKFNLSQKITYQFNDQLTIEGLKFPLNFVNVGSPHAVIDYENLPEQLKYDFESFDLNKYGKLIRHADLYKPEGVNVNIFRKVNNSLELRTYEKGVETETLACGTGAVAASIVAYLFYNITPEIQIIPKSKQKLFVNFQVENNEFNKMSLSGPVEEIFSGEMLY